MSILIATLQTEEPKRMRRNGSYMPVRFLIALFLSVGLYGNGKLCEAGSARGGSAGALLRLSAGARAAGMGGAFVAVVDDASVGYWNPAGLVWIEGRKVMESYRSMSLDRRQNIFGYAQSVRSEAGIGLYWIYGGTGKIVGRDINGRRTENEKISDSQNVFYLSFGRKVRETFSVGMTMKYFYHKLYDQTGKGFGFDLGALMKPSGPLTVGLAVTNLRAKSSWQVALDDRTSSTEDDLPEAIVLGIAYRLLPYRVLVSADLGGSQREGFLFRAGSEFILNEVLQLRAGLNGFPGWEDMLGRSVNGGISLRPMKESAFQVHYAYITDEIGAGPTHHFSTTVTF